MKRISISNDILIEEIAKMLDEGKEVVLLARGNSMRPSIRHEKDSLVMRKMPSVKVGDAVLARVAPKVYVAHRIIGIDGDKVTLKGDGNLVGTEICSAVDVLGTIVQIQRPDGKRVQMPRMKLWNCLGPFTRRCLLKAISIIEKIFGL